MPLDANKTKRLIKRILLLSIYFFSSCISSFVVAIGIYKSVSYEAALTLVKDIESSLDSSHGI